MEMLLFLFLILGRLLWMDDWSQDRNSDVLIYFYCIFVLVVVLEMSRVIALRRIYFDNCSRSCFYYCSYYKSIILVYCFPLLLLLFWASHM
jgi:hypothetical protein